MINLLIGSGESMDGFGIDNVVWDGTSKTLEVWIDINLDGEFELLSSQGLSYSPHPMSPQDPLLEAMQAM